ncbi:MAG: copper-translocating P-type ATPase [Anaerolineae bacterium]|nr:copper-translocating P-type ATPase [Anaerolineae bacterium]MDQ7036816.1 copper-translocating P-type ATPase [Anaerolineae bacterium]
MSSHAHSQHEHSQHEHEAPQEHDDHSGHGTDHSGHEMMFRNRFWVNLILSIPVLLFSAAVQRWLGFSMPEFTGSQFIGPFFSVIVFIYGGIPFLEMAVPEIRNRLPGMMTLISLAISVAFAYSLFALFTGVGEDFFWELVTLIDVMLLGHWIEMRSIRQASGALNELAKLLPDIAERIKADGSTEEVSVSALQSGDLVLVRPGASIAADGEIVDGQSDINEAMITGESLPVKKSTGDKVIAGTINGDGSLRLKVTATGDETALAGIMRLVEEAQKSKSATQILADKAAGWLFYLAIVVAGLTTVGWIIADGYNLNVLARVVTVLVIACPHALGLAIPLVVAISTSMGAKNGILVRNRLALEAARNIDTIIFDKTGTLTEGRFGVVDMLSTANWDSQQTLALIAGVEGDSEHPIARGIRQKAEDDGIAATVISNFEAIKGRGIKAQWDGKTVHVGGPRLLELLNLTLTGDIEQFANQANDNAQTIIYLVVDGEIAAGFALADVVREESKQAVDKLHQLGVEVAMLTGDSQAVADAVARQLGIDTVFAEVLPEHKDSKVQELQQQGKKVAMVGDGVNDAPALTRADIGIAIGSGTDVAIEAADIILVRSNPLDVVNIFELSRATYRKMIENLIWATGYNLFALPLAAGVLAPIGFILSPAVGAAFMSLSTVVVAINAQLLKRTQLSTA